MINFGKRVKELRQAKKITKEDFCGDETELSTRQLTRIESGVSTPTLAKVIFIAQRLGVKVGELADEEQFKLPKRYKELKFLLLHTQTHMNPEKILQREKFLDEIFQYFYDDLPEEEQLVIEVLHSQLEIFVRNESHSANKILHDYLAQTLKKTIYHTNDLILLHLYFLYLDSKNYKSSLFSETTYSQVIQNLLSLSEKLPAEKLFLLNQVLISAFGRTESLNYRSKHIQNIINALEQSFQKIPDLQKLPILNLMKWKHQIYIGHDPEKAKAYFDEAHLFAKLTQDEYLLTKLELEWKKDLSNL